MSLHDVHGWLSSNSIRAYPFKENAYRIPTIVGTPTAVIPNGVIIDLLITTPYSTLKETVPGFVFEHIPPVFKLAGMIRTATDVTFAFTENPVPFTQRINQALYQLRPLVLDNQGLFQTETWRDFIG